LEWGRYLWIGPSFRRRPISRIARQRSSRIGISPKTTSSIVEERQARAQAQDRGGVSEAAFEFDEGGDLWAVTRNEDGDRSGFGSHVAWAPAGDLGAWRFPSPCDPERYDSPRMFRRGRELYLLARRDVGGPYDMGLDLLPIPLQRSIYLPAYSSRPKRSALYRIDRERHQVEHLIDLPGAADTAFPSVLRASADEFLVANYTSPLWFKHRSWLEGQLSVFGTSIYLVWLRFTDLPE